ncbi:DUF2975 domain-containing protein [Anaerorhabdus sp.]|uniref:DUF2975 domain-containing protein n=1 Tax=Anaerorhabdus sp. TaxID=1872524 RepID=UPI002FC8A1DC
MKNMNTIFLRACIVIVAIVVMLMSIFFIPPFANKVGEIYPIIANLRFMVILIPYATLIPFYFALYKFMVLLNLIDQGNAFSVESVKILNIIKKCAILITILYLFILPLVYIVADIEDAPGLLLILGCFSMVPFVIGIFAGVLEKLLDQAVQIKAENDLVV